MHSQLVMLMHWADDHHHHNISDFLAGIAEAVDRLNCCVPEAVRDVASKLPLRRLDYGTEVGQ